MLAFITPWHQTQKKLSPSLPNVIFIWKLSQIKRDFYFLKKWVHPFPEACSLSSMLALVEANIINFLFNQPIFLLKIYGVYDFELELWNWGELCATGINNLRMWRLRFLELYNELYSKRVEFDSKAPTFVMKICLV